MSEDILTRLERLEAMLIVLVERETVKDWYTTQEFARKVARRNSPSASIAGEGGYRRRNGKAVGERIRNGCSPMPSWSVTAGMGCCRCEDRLDGIGNCPAGMKTWSISLRADPQRKGEGSDG
jgi:hypothetical protein